MLSDDSAAPLFESQSDQEPPQQIQKKQKSIFEIFGNLPMITFLCGAILSIACSGFFFIDNNMGYIVSAPIGVSISLFGIKHFHQFIKLKHEIDEFSKKNLKFKRENKKVKKSVDVLSAAHHDLQETQGRIHRSNQTNRENLYKFRELQDNMGQCNASSIEQLGGIISKCRVIENRWKENLYKQERRMLHIVFDRFCSYQKHIGMNRKEFDEFTLELPIEYQERFGRIGNFEKISGGKDVILYEDFEATLDIFAEMQATDCDIEFEIKSTKTLRDRTPSMIIQQKKIEHLNTMRQASVYQYIIDEENENELGIDTNYNMDNDDRKYDDDLIKYKSVIVITRYSKPKTVSFKQNLFAKELDFLSDDEENEEMDVGELFRGKKAFRSVSTYNPNVLIRDMTAQYQDDSD